MLRKSRLVYVWRRVKNLQAAKASVNKLLKWPMIGETEDTIQYDAGGAIVGYWEQPQAKLSSLAYGYDYPYSCSLLAFARFDLGINPASTLEAVAPNFEATVAALNDTLKGGAAPIQNETGAAVSFFDEGGNRMMFVRPPNQGQGGQSEDNVRKLSALLRNRGLGGGDGAQKSKKGAIVGLRRLVSNLNRSRKFYRQTLRLKMLSSKNGVAKFDLGSAILTLEQESAVGAGLTRALHNSRRLLGDVAIFHVKDARAKARKLEKAGIRLKRGVEESGVGLVAHFEDPDGHELAIWQPSGVVTGNFPVNFYPVLSRILKERT